PTRPTPSRARSGATWRWRCRTTSCTAPTRPSRRSARSRSGSQTTSLSELTPHARQNREFWDRYSDEYHDRNARFIEHGLAWGMWQIPESELRVLGDVAGKDVLELGCGAAEWSRALARAGARPVGLDNSESR